MVASVTIALLISVGLVAWVLHRHFAADTIGAIIERRRATSRMVSRGVLVQEGENRPVALVLTRSTFTYEGAGINASLEVQFIRDVEYDTKLLSGAAVRGKVMRLRCYGRMFEFVLPDDAMPRWHMMLPPQRAMKALPTETTPVQVAI